MMPDILTECLGQCSTDVCAPVVSSIYLLNPSRDVYADCREVMRLMCKPGALTAGTTVAVTLFEVAHTAAGDSSPTVARLTSVQQCEALQVGKTSSVLRHRLIDTSVHEICVLLRGLMHS